MSIVHVENLRHLYGAHVAIDGVGFDVAPGECFGLLGPNGSGKSTLFKILTTLLPPTTGRAVVAGYDVTREQADVRRHIGVVFQSPSLDIHLTVRENLVHGGRLYGLPIGELRARIDELLTALALTDRAHARVKTLSGGLKRRVELAKCLLHRPALLILDEPCTGLDPRARRELWHQLDTLRRERGMTLLLTTHDMEEADRCDRLALFDRGRIVALGAPADLKRRIGGDCVTIDAADAESLATEIDAAYGEKPVRFDGLLRVETNDGANLMARLIERFGSRIRSVTLARPTLEDVFVHETGHRFEERNEEGSAA